jgi:hypothetical protein
VSRQSHFYRRRKCAKRVDKRKLSDVIFHETDHTPKPWIPDITGKRILKKAFSAVRIALESLTIWYQ